MDKVKASVSNISYYNGGTALDEGLQESREKLFSAEHGMRANVPHVLLAFTDGMSNKGKVLGYRVQICSRPSVGQQG